jgi:hypothetical protein
MPAPVSIDDLSIAGQVVAYVSEMSAPVYSSMNPDAIAIALALSLEERAIKAAKQARSSSEPFFCTPSWHDARMSSS